MSTNYQEITNKFVAGVEAAIASGKQLPWRGITPSLPHNGASNRSYHGINVFLLWLRAQEMNYTNNGWFTFKQANALKGCVRKGEKGTMIFFWSFIEKKAVGPNGEDRTAKVPLLRTFYVFNHAQIEWQDGIGPGAQKETTPCSDNVLKALEVLRSSNPTLKPGNPAYSPSQDTVYMPENDNSDLYAATFAHEMIHWTGHKSRCNRNQEGGFGSESYAFEELIAELGAAFFCAEYGVQNTSLDENHTAYLQSWLKKLKNDPYALFRAARFATDAINHLTGKTSQEEEVAEAA